VAGAFCQIPPSNFLQVCKMFFIPAADSLHCKNFLSTSRFRKLYKIVNNTRSGSQKRKNPYGSAYNHSLDDAFFDGKMNLFQKTFVFSPFSKLNFLFYLSFTNHVIFCRMSKVTQMVHATQRQKVYRSDLKYLKILRWQNYWITSSSLGWLQIEGDFRHGIIQEKINGLHA